MTDADVDGSHIRTLLLTFFYRYFPELIANSHIFIAQPPLYAIKHGKDIKYAYSDEEKQEILKDLEKNKGKAKEEKAAKSKKEKTEDENAGAENNEDGSPEEVITIGGTKVNIQRYKGLGEMNAEDLWETTMNPQKRIMKKVTSLDAEMANETFEILMGDEVEPRKKFIQTYAKSVENIDI